MCLNGFVLSCEWGLLLFMERIIAFCICGVCAFVMRKRFMASSILNVKSHASSRCFYMVGSLIITYAEKLRYRGLDCMSTVNPNTYSL